MNEEFNAGIQQQDEEKQVNYVDMFMRYLMYWPWILACLVVSLIVAFFMYKHATPVYKTDASMLIKTNDNQSAFRSSSFAGAISAQDMGMFSMASDFDTEVKVLASRNLIQHVIESLDQFVLFPRPQQRLGDSLVHLLRSGTTVLPDFQSILTDALLRCNQRQCVVLQ